MYTLRYTTLDEQQQPGYYQAINWQTFGDGEPYMFDDEREALDSFEEFVRDQWDAEIEDVTNGTDEEPQGFMGWGTVYRVTSENATGRYTRLYTVRVEPIEE